MKKAFVMTAASTACLVLAGCSKAAGVWTTVLILLGLLCLGGGGLGVYQYLSYLQKQIRRPERYRKRPLDRTALLLLGVGTLLILAGILVSCSGAGREETPVDTTPETTVATEPPSLFCPKATAQTSPQAQGIVWDIFNGIELVREYSRQDPISFESGSDYFALPGICTFRGTPYRDTTSYGTANITQGTLTTLWEAETSVLPGASWSGSGWTGQPLVVQWDEATRQSMDLYPEKKAKAELVEVIYATLDGHIYFLDLADGSYTRDPLFIGQCFKGSGALDPRGYPLMYVGSGDVNAEGKKPRMYVISLIDSAILYEYGWDDPLSIRYDHNGWSAFDSSPLVHAGTDTLIWPGENGLLYTIHLNTQYDAQAGTISVSPDDPVLTRYDTGRSGEEDYWYGYEASASIVENYLYVSENGGMFYCVDLNTMKLIWAQDTKDDSNASPVFERAGEEGGYLYTAPSLHWTKDEAYSGTVNLYKLDAITGQILWEVPYDVYTEEGVSGGVQSTPLLGKAGTDMEGLILYSVSRTPNRGTGLLVALDTETGREVWRHATDFFAWSSPVCVYTPEGKGYVLLGDSGGRLHLLDGSTGALLQRVQLNGNIEATPVIFHDTLVLGTREKKIYGIQIS